MLRHIRYHGVPAEQGQSGFRGHSVVGVIVSLVLTRQWFASRMSQSRIGLRGLGESMLGRCGSSSLKWRSSVWVLGLSFVAGRNPPRLALAPTP